MSPPQPARDRMVSVVRWELFKVGLILSLVIALGVWWFLSWFSRNHCECLWQECFNIVLNVKQHGACWRY